MRRDLLIVICLGDINYLIQRDLTRKTDYLQFLAALFSGLIR